MLPQAGRVSRLSGNIAWRGCAAVSTFLSDFTPRAAPVIASASFLAFAARAEVEAGVPRKRRATAVPRDAREREQFAALLRGGLSGG
jgi:hypothetical protein